MTFHRLAPCSPRRPAGILARLRTALAEWRTLAALAQLDDHLLSDIGFVRVPEAGRARLVA